MELFQSPYRVLSVDPGKSGAVCVLGKGLFKVFRDFESFQDIAYGIRDAAAFGGITHAVMELVHAMPGQGVCSMFSFGRASGAADGALALAVPHLGVEQVTPQKWQQFFRARFSVPKEVEFDSRSIAAKVLPLAAPYLKRVKDHNSADAILIGAYALLRPEH